MPLLFINIFETLYFLLFYSNYLNLLYYFFKSIKKEKKNRSLLLYLE